MYLFILKLTDVEDGGYTAFPFLNFSSPVEKGAALVSQNLHSSDGSIDIRLYHGSCPLLKGNKWGNDFFLNMRYCSKL